MTSPSCDKAQNNESTITRVSDRFLFCYLLVVNYVELVVFAWSFRYFTVRSATRIDHFHLFEIRGYGRECKLYQSHILFRISL